MVIGTMNLSIRNGQTEHIKPLPERLADQLEDPVNAKLYLAPYIAAELRRLVSFNNDLMDEVARLQKREWVGLNWDELPDTHFGDAAFLKGAQWAEAKIKEKNT